MRYFLALLTRYQPKSHDLIVKLHDMKLYDQGIKDIADARRVRSGEREDWWYLPL